MKTTESAKDLAEESGEGPFAQPTTWKQCDFWQYIDLTLHELRESTWQKHSNDTAGQLNFLNT